MAVSGHLLILLLPVLSLCGATEYYVRPTEPTNTSCPAQPCLTLSQYTDDSDHYFKSNTVFKFLPGTHHMDRPLTIGNVHNVSLENMGDESDQHPHLVAQFPCETEERECFHVHEYWYYYNSKVCCAAIWLHEVYNVTVKGISITGQASNKVMSLVILKNVSGTTVQLNGTCLSRFTTLGVVIYEATSVEVHSSSVSNCLFGLLLQYTTNTHITKVTTVYNTAAGVALDMATDTRIDNTIAANNTHGGLHLSTMSNTYINNIDASHNGEHGIHLYNMNNTYISNTTAAGNRDQNGIFSRNMNNTHMANITTSHNGNDGMWLSFNMSNTYITNMRTEHNKEHGIHLSNMIGTYIHNLTTMYNKEKGMDLSTMSNTYMTNTVATSNSFIGMYLSNMNNTHITKTSTTHNGMAAYTSIGTCCGQIVILSSTYTQIYNTSFTDIYTPSTASTANPTRLPAVIVLYESTLHINDCGFTGNNISAVRAHASNITVSGDVTFSNNRAFAGTAFVLIYGSILTSSEKSHIYFRNNHATNTGGVFYITNNNIYLIKHHEHYYERSTCFLNTEGSRSQKRFTFVNNSAGKGGDILYGGQVALGLDGEQNCLVSFNDTSNISQSGLSLVSSDPSRVCLCYGRGQPDCIVVYDPTPHTVYPGQTINISAVVVGQNFGTVAGSVYAQFLQIGKTPKLESGQEVQGVTQHKCNHLYYTILTQSEASEVVLILTTQDSYVSEFDEFETSTTFYSLMNYYKTDAFEPLLFNNNPVYINISLLPCPPGFMLTTHTPFKCDCNSLLQQMYRIKCHIQNQTIGRSGLLWVGMIWDENGTNGTVAASEYCPLDYCNTEDSNMTLSDPDSQCNYNHSGTLCGGCQPGLSVALGSTQCLQCSNKYLALLIPLTLAGPVLVLFIKMFDLTISQGTLSGLIFYANIVKANEYIFLHQGQTNPLTLFISWLNLDLGVETCLFQDLTAYSKTWLQFVFPFYIWSIAGLIIILARYSDRVAKVMGNNSVPVLATLFLLSHAKLLRTIITALSYTVVYTSHGPKAVWTADGNVDYLGPKHAPLFATAVAVLLFLWFPYTLVLFLGQWLHRCNCRLVVRMLMKMKPFLDAHYGPLKSKHRYWFGALLLVRATVLLISALIPANRSSIIVLCISIISVMLTHFGHLVYRNLPVAMFDITFFMNLALLGVANFFTTIAGGDMAVSAYTLIGVAFIQFVGLVVFKVFSILQQSKKVTECFYKKQTDEDDWELYEQAAIQRGMESDTVEQDSDDSGSIESLLTY